MKRGFTLIELLIVLAMLVVAPAVVIAISFWTDNNLEWALSLVKGAEVQVPFILSLILTVIGNVVTVLANVVCEIAKLVI